MFVTVTAAVHAAGDFCYSHQTKQPGNRGSQVDWANVRDPLDDWNISHKATNVASSAIDLRYRSALKAAFFEQAISLLITSMILDGGGIFRIALIAASAHSIAVLRIVLRRPFEPSRLDLWVIEYGYFIAMMFVDLADATRQDVFKT